ncbi:hypothetical protein [Mesonia mobilis]|uniref:Membrane protein involved in the export of O-antigen and teichoic acid n=1 Tax=Mesonia mobilis TaxID=369791 RepID=A0ABQ3C0Y3_9FLAO|nr:hypothetical protein [Mesonia mobilis]GGZ60366.1 hypothetical protein GCM10008088_22330 [Mesonia mobilis]
MISVVIKKVEKNLSIVDQGLLSLLNFGSIFVLSSVLEKSLFSDFVILYSYSVFLTLFTSITISSPILIYYSKKWSGLARSYSSICLILNIIIVVLLSTIIYFFIEKQVTATKLYSFIFLSFGVSSYDILRRFCYSIKNGLIFRSFLSTIILNLFFFSLIFICRPLNINIICNIYGVSFIIPAIYLFFNVYYYKSNSIKPKQKSISIRLVSDIHFQYSKWLVIGGISFWAYNQGIYLYAKFLNFSDLAIGKVRILQNLMGVFTILTITLENYFKPIFSTSNDVTELVRKIYKKKFPIILFLFIAAFPIGLFSYNYIYASKYGSGLYVYIFMFAVQIILVSTKLFSVALKSREITKTIFVGHILASLVMLISITILKSFNNQDLIIAMSNFFSTLIFCIYIFYNYKKLKR